MRKRRVKSTSDAAEHSTPLVRVLDQSESVQEKVETAATDLASVNVVLKDEVHRGAPLKDVRGALDKSIDVEVKMQEAADELIAVNDALAVEIDDRIAIQQELVESKAALTVSLVEERRARHDALHDDVTGLPNAALFKDRLQSALVQARRHAWGFAVMFIDLDGFKAINDRHGHDIGDGVLRLVADRLREFVRDGDTVSRRSGDEFLREEQGIRLLSGHRDRRRPVRGARARDEVVSRDPEPCRARRRGVRPVGPTPSPLPSHLCGSFRPGTASPDTAAAASTRPRCSPRGDRRARGRRSSRRGRWR